jgi:hypothetical protein
MRTLKHTLAAALIVAGLAGCGTTNPPRSSQTPAPDTGEEAIARQLDGFYGAELPAANLRAALREIKPPVLLSGGWWSLTINVAERRVNLSHTEGDNVELRMIAVGDGHIELAPDTACEQRGEARTEPARLNWTRSGTYLRFHAVNVPCLTDQVLLTLTAWQRS